MKSFLAKMHRIERDDTKILNISVAHGFRAADVAEMGTKVVAIRSTSSAPTASF